MSELIFNDHDSYKTAQLAANARKINQVFACQAEIDTIVADMLKAMQSRLPKRGCCHGARNGWEVERFHRMLACEIIGTDIAPTAAEHGLLQMDFHRLPADWSNRFDFVYSNSLDHSYDPAGALSEWVRSLRPRGRLYLAHSRNSTYAQNEADCFGASLKEYAALVQDVCPYVKTIWLGDQRNASGGLVRDLVLIVGEKQA